MQFKRNENPIHLFRFSSLYHMEAIYSTSMRNSMIWEKNPQFIPFSEEFKREFFKFNFSHIFSYIFSSSTCTYSTQGFRGFIWLRKYFAYLWKTYKNMKSCCWHWRIVRWKRARGKNKGRETKTETKIKKNNWK